MVWLISNRMRLVVVGIVAAVALGGGRAKADTIWIRKADMPTPRYMHTSAVVDGKIYVIGGRPSEGTGPRFSTVEEFDPVTNTWTRKTDMPIARAALSSSVVNGRIYAIGGGSDDGHSIVEEYDPVKDIWTRKADMPTGRWSLATCATNGKIYAFGGLISSSPILSIKSVEEYDPSTDTWTKKMDMPTPIPQFNTGLWGLCANVVNERIYVLGGRPVIGAIPNVYEYKLATETWTRKTNMPVFTSQMASVALGDKIVVIGGWYDSSCSPHKAVQIYDPETDTWTREADTPFLRACCSASVVNNKIYVIGGTDRPHSCIATSTVFEFGPVVDFNGDGIVDSADVCIMVDNWGTDDSLCDIGPMPWGDGIVDVQDLIVLAEHLFTDYRATAQWKLDEEEGDIAYDNVSGHDATLHGEPLWQPTGGRFDGALEFDGMDDYVSTPFVLNPAIGSFSAFAWIKSVAPGDVIVTQAGSNGETWLSTSPSDGKLMTGLGDTYFDILESESIIVDGQWHHIGLVYDMDVLHRRLYVDGAQVAEDATFVAPQLSNEGLYIGASKDLDAASFFSGLIDDVRIYNRVVSP